MLNFFFLKEKIKINLPIHGCILQNCVRNVGKEKGKNSAFIPVFHMTFYPISIVENIN